MKCVSSDNIDNGSIKRGDAVYAVAISGANVWRDAREAVTNIVGGRMKRYEEVLDKTIERALSNLRERAKEYGYDGVISLRISHPHITDGAVEVVVYGTGFYYISKDNSKD